MISGKQGGTPTHNACSHIQCLYKITKLTSITFIKQWQILTKGKGPSDDAVGDGHWENNIRQLRERQLEDEKEGRRHDQPQPTEKYTVQGSTV